MACPKCDPKLNPKRQPKNRLGVRFGHYDFNVFRLGEQIAGVYELQVPDRAWRYKEPVRPCKNGCRGAEAYIDTHGPFEVRR